MAYYGLDYVAQIGTVFIMFLFGCFMIYVFKRLLVPIVERGAMKERVKMAFTDKELEKFCIENGVDYSKIDINLHACYKKKNNKLQDRLNEIEESM